MITNEALFETILNNISDAIITIDFKGIIQTVNHVVEDMFGYSESELVQHNINVLLPKPQAQMHDSYLQHYKETGQKHIIGKSRELEAQRKNGEIFAIELFVHEIALDEKHHFLGIIRDISERKYMEQMKAEFVSTVSHELRTPLTSIKGSLGMVNSGILGELPEKAQRMVTLAHNNTERLILLVNDLLDMEKIQAGKIDLHLEKVNITQVIRDSIEANQAYAHNLNVEVVLVNTPEECFVEADKNRLMQVMANLISNAAKYSPVNQQVEITAFTDQHSVTVSIQDYGQGIPEEYHAQMFKKFTQVDSSDTRQKGGTGLGLNITKAIVEHHGGQIDFNSELNKGSTFFFILPLWHKKEIKHEIITCTPVVSSQKNAGRVLVLEDEPDIAKLLKLMLEQQDFEVTTCNTAKQAKALLSQQSFDVMTVDLRLPDQNGLSLIKELRTNPETQDLAIIIVSAEADIAKQTNITTGLKVIDWIEKPIDQQHLITSIQASVKESQHPPKILYIEDDSDLTLMMSTLLNDKITVIPAKTLHEAKRLLHDDNFDLVILDVGLPDGSGLDILPILDEHFTTTPIIIFSGESLTGEVVNRVDAALIKSQVNNNELVQTIKNLIKLK